METVNTQCLALQGATLEASNLESKQLMAAKMLSLTPLHKLSAKLFRPIVTIMDKILGLKKVEIHQISDFHIPISTDNRVQTQIKIRAYYPHKKKSKKTLVYFHGGGCVIGSINSHDRFCRYLAKYGNMNIISVDYRLAPEYKFPTPICDSIDAWNWINENHNILNITLGNIGVGGDSAGAYLACLIGLKSQQQELLVQAQTKPDFQFLIYPMLDLQGLSKSYRKFNKNLILTRDLMDYFKRNFLNNLDEASLPLVSPLQVNDVSESPDTYVLTLGFDPLRDDGIAYANRLKKSGINTIHEHYNDCMHAFISVAKLSHRARQATHNLALALNNFNY
jgi:acetyl esterase